MALRWAHFFYGGLDIYNAVTMKVEPTKSVFTTQDNPYIHLEAYKVTEKDKRYIDIFIDYVDLSHLVLEVKNGISQKVVIEGNHVRTTKEDVRNHGIGLRNVISTVEKYDGYLNLDSTETEFIAKVFL